MLTRQVVLLLVGVVHFVVFRASITKKVVPTCVLLRILMFAVQSIKRLCTDFWIPYLAQKGAEVR